MEILEIIDKLEEKIDKAMNIPFINRSLMDKEDLLADIEDIRLQLPEELKQARWMKEERKKDHFRGSAGGGGHYQSRRREDHSDGSGTRDHKEGL